MVVSYCRFVARNMTSANILYLSSEIVHGRSELQRMKYGLKPAPAYQLANRALGNKGNIPSAIVYCSGNRFLWKGNKRSTATRIKRISDFNFPTADEANKGLSGVPLENSKAICSDSHYLLFRCLSSRCPCNWGHGRCILETSGDGTQKRWFSGAWAFCGKQSIDTNAWDN